MASSDPRNLYLQRLTEGQNYRELHFRQQNSILGRGKDCDLVIRSKFVSRRHCEIEFRNGKMFIRNIVSTNGTFVNGTKIKQETELKEGDMVGIGSNTASLKTNRMNEDFLIYEVIDPIETIDLNSSDDEQHDKIAESSTLPMDKDHAFLLSPPTLSDESVRSLLKTRTPGPSKRARRKSKKVASQSKKKVRSSMNFSGDFKGGPKGDAGSSCSGSSSIPKSRREPSLEKQHKTANVLKKLEKADPVELASIKSTTIQRAAGKSIQSPNVEKRALDPPTSDAREGKQEKPEKKMKRPAAICIGDEDKISSIKKVKLSRGPIIIDAPHLCKSVSSVKPGPSATSTPLASRKTSLQSRLSVDAPLVTPEGRGQKEKLATERKEKLRLLAERDKERKAAQEETKKRINTLKEKPKTVLVKVKNRGDFLSEIPEKSLIPPRCHSVSNSPKVTTTSSDPMSRDILLSKLREFLEQNMKVKVTAVNHSEATAGHKPPPAECTPIEAPEAPPVVYQTSGTSLTSILKRNVRFEEDDSGNIVTHVREIENNQSDRLPLDPMEQFTEGVKKKLAREQYWSQQRIVSWAECQPSSTSTSVSEARQPQQNVSKVNFDNSHENRSAPSPVSPISKPSDVMISNEQQMVNRILQWKTEWLQTANPQPEAGRGRGIEQELLSTVVSKYQEWYKNSNDSWDILTVKEVSRLNLELCDLTFFSSESKLPRNYEIGSLLLLETNESSSFGYISRIWRGAGEARFITIQTSLDYSKLDIFDDVKSRYVWDIQKELKSINARSEN